MTSALPLRRRAFLGSSVALAALAGTGCTSAMQQVFQATGFSHGPASGPPAGTHALVNRAFSGLDRSLVWDMHAHVMGLGTDDSGASVSAAYREGLVKRGLFAMYLEATGIEREAGADARYLKRLLDLQAHANPLGKVVLLAFDMRVNEDGVEDLANSEIYVPNSYIYRLARHHPQVRVGASIHPYRKDALARLDEAHEHGAVLVKWLPNAQGIDPMSKHCDAFFQKLADKKMALLSHAGHEAAVDSKDGQAFGNVMRLRRALDQGVRVIVPHCAGLGTDHDLDKDGKEAAEMESFDLFLKLMADKQYDGRLFGDISAMTQFNRCGRPLRELITLKELHPRLLNGSDYPLPAFNPLISTRVLEAAGYLTTETRDACNKIYAANPLLFDFMVKRSLRVHDDKGEHRFADVVFESGRIFGQ